MSSAYDKPIPIQIQDPETEAWSDLWHLHARVNRVTGDTVNTEAGAQRVQRKMGFDIKYFSNLLALAYDQERYRIIYQNHYFQIEDYDDYMERHISVRLTGVSYE